MTQHATLRKLDQLWSPAVSRYKKLLLFGAMINDQVRCTVVADTV